MAKRQSVNFPGFAHQNPIPNASRIGNMMMSSVISGVIPGTRNLPANLAGAGSATCSTSIGRAVEAAGGTPDNILKITFWMKEPGTGRAALNEESVERCSPTPTRAPGPPHLGARRQKKRSRHLRLRRGVRLAPAASSGGA